MKQRFWILNSAQFFQSGPNVVLYFYKKIFAIIFINRANNQKKSEPLRSLQRLIMAQILSIIIMTLKKIRSIYYGNVMLYLYYFIKTKLMATLYQRLGGAKAVDVVIDKFYDYMLSDPDTRHFFSNIDIEKQRIRMKQYMIMMMGGPNSYLGKSIKTAHEKLKISKTDFDHFWDHIEHAMKYYKIEQVLIDQVKRIIYSVQKDIVKVESHNQKQAKKSLFQRLGGQKGVSQVVDKYYEEMVNDPVTGSYFDKTNMQQLVQKQKHFITKITGGPSNYEGDDMKKAHQKYNIGKKQFNQAWRNWQKALKQNHVNLSQINDFKNVIYSMENQVQH